MLQPGDRIGPYEVVERIGGGEIGVTFRVRQRLTGAEAVLKCPTDQSDVRSRRRLRAEAGMLRRLDHPALPRLAAIQPPVDSGCLALEYQPGQTLRAWIARHQPVPLDLALDLVDQIAAGIEYAHRRGVRHHDLKPENVILDESGVVHIIDFGSADRGRLRLPWRRIRMTGTPDYAAPEVARGAQGGVRADVYQLGAMLYELLAGVGPFSGDSPAAVLFQAAHVDPEPPSAFRPGIPDAVVELVMHALKKDPTLRPPDVAAWRSALQAARRGPTVAGRSAP